MDRVSTTNKLLIEMAYNIVTLCYEMGRLLFGCFALHKKQHNANKVNSSVTCCWYQYISLVFLSIYLRLLIRLVLCVFVVGVCVVLSQQTNLPSLKFHLNFSCGEFRIVIFYQELDADPHLSWRSLELELTWYRVWMQKQQQALYAFSFIARWFHLNQRLKRCYYHGAVLQSLEHRCG